MYFVHFSQFSTVSTCNQIYLILLFYKKKYIYNKKNKISDNKSSLVFLFESLRPLDVVIALFPRRSS